jgi:ribose transport system substrate-binding protein
MALLKKSALSAGSRFVFASATGLFLTAAAVTSSAAADAADPVHEYAPGIPTLEQLYASSEYSPPTTGPKMPSDKSVIFLSCGQLSAGCSGPVIAMEKIAKQIGWKYKIIDGAFGANDGYNSGLRQAIAAKPDAIVVHGIACTQIVQPLKEAKAAGIPVINIQAVDCDDPKNPGGSSEPLFVNMQFNKAFKSAGEFFYQWGFIQASYVIDATQGHARIIRDKFVGSVQGEYQAAGQDAALAKCADCKVLGAVEWVATDAGAGGVLNQKFTTLLTKFPTANAAIFSYDVVATSCGLSKEIADAGRQKSMFVVAGEGYAPALQLIRDGGGLTADVGQSSEWMAWGAVDAMNRYFNKSPQVPQGIGYRLIDASHNLGPEGKDYAPPNPPIDLSGTYLKSWGVK